MEHGGSLVSLHGPSKNTRVGQVAANKLGQKSFWIGIENSNHLSWNDGSPFNYYNWHTGEPNLEKQCAQYDLTGKWSTVECSQTGAFLCQIPRPQVNCDVKVEDRLYVQEIMNSMYDCRDDGNCWDGRGSPEEQCFHPKRKGPELPDDETCP